MYLHTFENPDKLTCTFPQVRKRHLSKQKSKPLILKTHPHRSHHSNILKITLVCHCHEEGVHGRNKRRWIHNQILKFEKIKKITKNLLRVSIIRGKNEDQLSRLSPSFQRFCCCCFTSPDYKHSLFSLFILLFLFLLSPIKARRKDR